TFRERRGRRHGFVKKGQAMDSKQTTQSAARSAALLAAGVWLSGSLGCSSDAGNGGTMMQPGTQPSGIAMGTGGAPVVQPGGSTMNPVTGNNPTGTGGNASNPMAGMAGMVGTMGDALAGPRLSARRP